MSVRQISPPAETDRVLGEVRQERARQHLLWGEQDLPDGTSTDPEFRKILSKWRGLVKQMEQDGDVTYFDVLLEEVLEVMVETNQDLLRQELIQVAAVAVKWVEALDRRSKE